MFSHGCKVSLPAIQHPLFNLNTSTFSHGHILAFAYPQVIKLLKNPAAASLLLFFFIQLPLRPFKKKN